MVCRRIWRTLDGDAKKNGRRSVVFAGKSVSKRRQERLATEEHEALTKQQEDVEVAAQPDSAQLETDTARRLTRPVPLSVLKRALRDRCAQWECEVSFRVRIRERAESSDKRRAVRPT